MKMRQSLNYRILRSILSKTRQIDTSGGVSYLIVYAFVYKYSSDMLKQYLLSLIKDWEMTLDEAYKNRESAEILKRDAFEMFGYHINDPDAFIDDIFYTHGTERFFIHKFFETFTGCVEFPENSNFEKYFRFIFDAVKSEINMKKFEFEGESHLIVRDIIYSISQLDVFDEDFPFAKVFETLIQTRPISAERNPAYVDQMLAYIITSIKTDIDDIYNPFLNDASSLIGLKNHSNFNFKKCYGKGFDKLTHCCSIANLFFNGFDLDNIFLDFSSPFESADINRASFDVITANIPPVTSKNLRKINTYQSVEMVKRNKRKELENILTSNFDIDRESFLNDADVSSALENLLNKMDLEKQAACEFHGEYEVLKQSEYLFLINLIDCLKDDGIMAVGLSQSFLFKNSLETLRKYLTVEKNYIDAIISVPDELSRPKHSQIIVIFKKNRTDDDIVFIDISRKYVALPVPNPVRGVFKRNLILSHETLKEVVEVYSQRKNVEKYSSVVGLDEISKNEYNLSISRYVDTFEGKFIKLEDLKHQKREIDYNLGELNKKIDMMMDELGFRL